MRIHLDTDLGGDPDDACALAMLLGWPEVEIVGITTTIDPGGRRAGCVKHVLSLAGRVDIPAAAGASGSSSHGDTAEPFDRDERYWASRRPGCPRSRLPRAGAVTTLGGSIGRGSPELRSATWHASSPPWVWSAWARWAPASSR